MGDAPTGTDGFDDGDDAPASPHASTDEAVAHRQDPLTAAPEGAEQTPFELTTFRRIDADHIDVMVCGMWSGDTPVMECYDSRDLVMVRVLGIDDDRCEPRPYRIVLCVEVLDSSVIEVRGTRRSERVATADVGDLPVVCGADPSMAGLSSAFLHSRGSQLVRVEPNQATPGSHARRSSITLVA